MPLEDGAFDIVVTERCLINLRGPADQAVAIGELARVLRPGGHYICIEAFMDGLELLNAAREQLGLPPNHPPAHNVWFETDWFQETVQRHLRRRDSTELGAPSNFLSSHYFISRVVYPAITRREILYNTEFVKFFSFLPPIGEYSPIQLYLFRKP
jgi:ubiquinone/menaquinone biosynthesis C-methylase UbiE